MLVMASPLTSTWCGQLRKPEFCRASQSSRQLEVVSTKRNTTRTVHSTVLRKEGMVVVLQSLALLSQHNPHLKRCVEEVMSIINEAGVHENLNIRGTGGCSDSQGERGRHHSAWLLEKDRGSFEKIFSEDAIISMLKEVVLQSLALLSKHNHI